jgi:hypothetical protein
MVNYSLKSPEYSLNYLWNHINKAMGKFVDKYLSKAVLKKYAYNVLTGNLLGFIVGMWATGLVSQFFETRSIHNLFGFRAKKTVIDKETFAWLEWSASVIVGFIVFEIMQKVVMERINEYWPLYEPKVKASIKERGYMKTGKLCAIRSYELIINYSPFKNSDPSDSLKE